MTHKSKTVSAVVITCNHGATVERALSSVQWADELLVFDCGSTDDTPTIARRFTDKVFFHPSAENPVLLRRDALSAASSDWLLLLEPDEWVEEMLRHEIDGILLSAPEHIQGYWIPRRLWFAGRWAPFPPEPEPSHVLRLVRRGQWSASEDRDGLLSVGGETGRLDRSIGYAPYRNIQELFAGMNEASTPAAYRHLETHGVSAWERSLFNLVFRTKLAAWKYVVFRGGLWNPTDFMLAMANTFAVFLKYAKIRALTEHSRT